MRSTTARTSQNKLKPPHHVIHQRRQSGNDLLSDRTGRHPHERSRHRSDAATHHQVSEVPPEMRHQHPTKLRSTWPLWNGTRWRWLQKHQQQPDMGCAYGSWNITSSTNVLLRGRINKISIREIYLTYESSTPTPMRCAPTREEENESR